MLWVIHNFSELKNFPYWGKIWSLLLFLPYQRPEQNNKFFTNWEKKQGYKKSSNLFVVKIFFHKWYDLHNFFSQYFSLHDYYPTIYIDNHQFHTLIHNRSKCTNVQIPHIVIIVTSLNENKKNI